MKHQQKISYHQDLFIAYKQNDIRYSDNRKDVNQTKARTVGQVAKVGIQGRALTENLMTIICSSSNLKQAYKQVKRNKGVPGVDNMPVENFGKWFQTEGETLVEALL